MSEAPRISPRARECLRLIWERQATSKEIAAELGISPTTVDGYIMQAVDVLGARNRRDAAVRLFGPRTGQKPPHEESGGEKSRVVEADDAVASLPSSTEAVPASRPWRSRSGGLNTLTVAQTLRWIAMIAIGSLAALALALSVGNGLRSIARPVLSTFDRLTH